MAFTHRQEWVEITVSRSYYIYPRMLPFTHWDLIDFSVGQPTNVCVHLNQGSIGHQGMEEQAHEDTERGK